MSALSKSMPGGVSGRGVRVFIPPKKVGNEMERFWMSGMRDKRVSQVDGN